MVWSINLLVLAVGLLIMGMIKPQWILFWMEKPIRMPIVILSAVLFMVAAVMFGEANKEKQMLAAKKTEQVVGKKSDEVPSVAVETVKEEKVKEEK